MTSKEDRPITTRLLDEVDVHIRQLGLVNGILSAVLAGASLPETLKIFYSNLKTLCPIDRMSISKYDAERRVFLVPMAIKGGRLIETNEPPRPFDTTPLSEAVRTRTAVLRKDIRQENSYAQDHEFIRRGFESEMFFPLVAGEEVFGTFQVGCFEADLLTERHLRIVSEILPAITISMRLLFDRNRKLFG